MIQTYYDITYAFLIMYFILSEMNVHYCCMNIFASFWCSQLSFCIKFYDNGLAGLKSRHRTMKDRNISVQVCYNDLVHFYSECPQKIALLPLFFNVAWEYAFHNIKENQKELIINWVHSCCNYVYILGENMKGKARQALLIARKETGNY
jgi:hypothetical protein